MSIRVSVYIAASLDGFIARENGEIDWLPGIDRNPAGEDYGYAAFMDTVDAIVLGRRTYETVLSFGSWPYEKPVFVLSNSGIAFPDIAAGRAERVSGDPRDVLAEMSSRGFHHVYLDGGNALQRFLAAGMVDTLILTRIPVLIGNGIPLFGALSGDVRLEHVSTKEYADGLVQSEYRIPH